MFRPVARAAVRTAGAVSSTSASSTSAIRRLPARRWASTAADKPRSWKSGAVRWGLAGAIVYYYNTSNVFAEGANDQSAHYPPPATSDTEELPTLDSYAKKPAPVPALSNAQTPSVASESGSTSAPAGGAGDLEAEASQQGAFNEETGEINWDCPCLGGMANGPCGEDFKAAFSCFVYSKEEPKGVDCIDKFKAMQDCFRAHPDIYGAELEDDEEYAAPPEGEGPPAMAKDSAESSLKTAASAVEDSAAPVIDDVKEKISDASDAIKDTTAAIKEKVADRASSAKDDIDETAATAKRSVLQEKGEVSESEELVPKAAHDARDANKEVKNSQKESKSKAR